MRVVFQVIHLLLYLYLIILIGRLVLDWIQVFAANWRPRGPMLVIAEGIYSVTDPPLRALRKVIPPLRIGNIALDLAFVVLMLLLWILLGVFSVAPA